MLADTSTPSNPQGFSPNVDNTVRPVTVTSGQHAMYICCWIFTLGLFGIWHYKKRNQLNEQQIAVNTAASDIDVALTKRRDTLIKLLEQVKSYYNYEGDVQTKITELRSMNTGNFNQAKELMDHVQTGLNMAFENYPNLKANQVVQDLMSSSEVLESEIAASRRLYNMKVEMFNGQIYNFPTNCVAHEMGLHNFALFAASNQEKQDVDMSSLNDYGTNQQSNQNKE